MLTATPSPARTVIPPSSCSVWPSLLRLAIPRRVYTNNHMDYIAAAAKNVYDRRESITRGYRIVKELPIMRHFTIELERADR